MKGKPSNARNRASKRGLIFLFDFGWVYYPEVDEPVEVLPEFLAAKVRVHPVIEALNADRGLVVGVVQYLVGPG